MTSTLRRWEWRWKIINFPHGVVKKLEKKTLRADTPTERERERENWKIHREFGITPISTKVSTYTSVDGKSLLSAVTLAKVGVEVEVKNNKLSAWSRKEIRKENAPSRHTYTQRERGNISQDNERGTAVFSFITSSTTRRRKKKLQSMQSSDFSGGKQDQPCFICFEKNIKEVEVFFHVKCAVGSLF
ncbi:hypothetical protein CDAR_503061 [Caerostris darwini]|uniref:Uncharacterized protein n=1 Tax=Caerostris darwini TaxID=1538125 RepID=A0AAV4VMJ5_9ARAC|nr:hypothetical protein CDAR_503061 [Caerostris darwini]